MMFVDASDIQLALIKAGKQKKNHCYENMISLYTVKFSSQFHDSRFQEILAPVPKQSPQCLHN